MHIYSNRTVYGIQYKCIIGKNSKKLLKENFNLLRSMSTARACIAVHNNTAGNDFIGRCIDGYTISKGELGILCCTEAAHVSVQT